FAQRGFPEKLFASRVWYSGSLPNQTTPPRPQNTCAICRKHLFSAAPHYSARRLGGRENSPSAQTSPTQPPRIINRFNRVEISGNWRFVCSALDETSRLRCVLNEIGKVANLSPRGVQTCVDYFLVLSVSSPLSRCRRSRQRIS